MHYCILDNENIIANIIIADEIFASNIRTFPWYQGALVGDTYSPPKSPPTVEERVESLESQNNLLKQQLQAVSSQNDFLEDCLAEMASIVYE